MNISLSSRNKPPYLSLQDNTLALSILSVFRTLYALTVNYFQIQQKYERRCQGKFRHVSYKCYRFAGAFEIEVYLGTVSQQVTVF